MTRRKTTQGQEAVLRSETYLGVNSRLRENVNGLRTYLGYSWDDIVQKTGYAKEHLYSVFLRSESVGNPCSLDLLVKVAEVLGTSPGKLLDIDLDIRRAIEKKLLSGGFE